MNLTSPSQVKAWCIEHDFHPNKVLGQNFLVDRNALESIVDAAALPTGVRVLEIGPGLGVLTEEMLRRVYVCVRRLALVFHVFCVHMPAGSWARRYTHSRHLCLHMCLHDWE